MSNKKGAYPLGKEPVRCSTRTARITLLSFNLCPVQNRTQTPVLTNLAVLNTCLSRPGLRLQLSLMSRRENRNCLELSVRTIEIPRKATGGSARKTYLLQVHLVIFTQPLTSFVPRPLFRLLISLRRRSRRCPSLHRQKKKPSKRCEILHTHTPTK